VHATGFTKDPVWHSPENANGGALYVEARIGEHAAVGAEGKYAKGDEEQRMYGGLTAKAYLPGPELLLLAEGELIQQKILAGAGDTANRIAAYAMASRALPRNTLLDIGIGHYTQDTRVKGLYRDCLDANVHWFFDSHAEFLVTTRLELTDGGSGRKGGYALAQLHFRL
jgi:hypothetical protein